MAKPPPGPRRRQPGGLPQREPPALPPPARRSWLGTGVRHMRGKELFRETELFRLHLGEWEGQTEQQEERNGCKGTKDLFALHKKRHGATFAMGKQGTWCRALKNRVGKNRGAEQGCMQDREREKKHRCG